MHGHDGGNKQGNPTYIYSQGWSNLVYLAEVANAMGPVLNQIINPDGLEEFAQFILSC